MCMLSIIILATATINHRRRMFHQFLTNMVVAIWLHLACKAMLSSSSKLLIKVEAGTNLVEPAGDSRQILTRSSQGEATVTTEEVGILVTTTNTINNMSSSIGMVKVGLSIITTHESMVVSSITVIISSKVVTAEEVIIVIVIKHKCDVLSLMLRAYESSGVVLSFVCCII